MHAFGACITSPVLVTIIIPFSMKGCGPRF